MGARRTALLCSAGALAALALASMPGNGGAAPGAGPLQIKVGQAKDFSRVEFHWAGGAAVRSRRAGQTVVLNFSRAADPNLVDLRVHPPKWLKTAEARQTGGGLELTLTLADGADAKVGQADGATYVNLFEKKTPEPVPASVAVQTAPRVDPVPAGGVVRAAMEVRGPQVLVRFPWKAPLGAAVFRRGDAVWAVFDARAKLDLSALKTASQITAAALVNGDGVSAVRFVSKDGQPINAWAEGPAWVIAIGPGVQEKPKPVSIGRDADAAEPAIAAAVAGATKIAWLADPVVGDRLAVVTAMAPSKGLGLRRDYVDFAVLSSANGLAIERAADDLKLNSDGDIVRIGRPGGLKISDAYARFDRKVEAAGLPKPAAMPALIPFAEWSKIEPNHFHDRYEQLLAAASDETQAEAQQDKTSGVQNRLALARFLVGSELSFEAIGVLDALGKSHEELLSNAEFRGLRGAAKVLAGRYKEAQTDLSSPVLSEEPSAALWRSYAAAQLSQWQDVRAEFARGLRAFDLTDPAWRAKFARAEAQAALELGDYISAKARIEQALSLNDDPVEQLQARLIQARLIEAQGAPDKALKLYEAVARAPQDQISAPALVRAVNIRLAQGKLTQDKAIETYESLRFRWRGDAVELQVIRALGQLHLDHGRYREALEVLRAAGKRLPDLPEALQLQADLAAAFRVLFLEGQADGLQPIQALAMFYDFRELTPVGAEGDEMVRKLAQRLVNVDLLDRAADLLKYQAENRLDGVPRASVAADQALIELMARKPEAALDALNSSRTTLLPTALAHQRRLLEARAWLQMNNPDHAAELLDGDRSPEAQALQAEVAWKRKDWAGAGRLYEVGLGRRFEDAAAPLTVDEEQRLLRAAAAYSLAADDGALARLRTRYGAFVDRARSPDALRVALAGADDQLNMGDVVKAVSDDEAFAGWVQKMKTRLRDQPLVKTSNPAPTPVPAPAKVAEAVGATAAG